MMRFEGKSAVVTGAASGIGLAAAKRMGSEGVRVLIADLDLTKAEAAAVETMNAGAPDAFAVTCDVAKEADVEKAVDLVIERFGKLDIVVNNAGVMVFKAIEEQSGDDWHRVLNVDLLGAFYFTKQAFMKMSGGGVIVNISSVHAVETTPLVSSYAAAKAALVSLTRSSSLEGKSKGIRVNAILPGAVDTPMLWENPNIKSGVETINLTDVGKPEDIASAIAYLASDDSKFIDGEALRVDGGRLSRL